MALFNSSRFRPCLLLYSTCVTLVLVLVIARSTVVLSGTYPCALAWRYSVIGPFLGPVKFAHILVELYKYSKL
jgi:hypothetical protein